MLQKIFFCKMAEKSATKMPQVWIVPGEYRRFLLEQVSPLALIISVYFSDYGLVMQKLYSCTGSICTALLFSPYTLCNDEVAKVQFFIEPGVSV